MRSLHFLPQDIPEHGSFDFTIEKSSGLIGGIVELTNLHRLYTDK
jgi:hypothetical protein